MKNWEKLFRFLWVILLAVLLVGIVIIVLILEYLPNKIDNIQQKQGFHIHGEQLAWNRTQDDINITLLKRFDSLMQRINDEHH